MKTLTHDALVFYVSMAVITEFILTWTVLQGGQLLPFSFLSSAVILITVASGAIFWRFYLPANAPDEP